MQTTVQIGPATALSEVLEIYPGAQRALFKRYHIGGCSSCAFLPGETLSQLCARNGNINVDEMIEHLKSSQEQDELMQIAPTELRDKLNSGVKLLDIRTREEWDAVRIEGSVRMSQENMQAARTIYEHPKDRYIPFSIYDEEIDWT